VLPQLLRHRRLESLSPRVAVRAPYDEVVALLDRQSMPAAIAPADAGWVTVVPLTHREHVVCDGELLVADLPGVLAGELGGVAVLLRVDGTGAAALTACAPAGQTAVVRLPEPGSTGISRSELCSVASLLGAGAQPDAVAEALSAHAAQPVTAAWVRLAQRDRAVVGALGLPPYLADPDLLGTPGDEREVLLVRAELADVRVAASAMQVPLVTAPLADGWRLVTACDPGDQVLPALAGLAAGRRMGLLLWRQGRVAGFVAARRRRVAEAHAWNTVWQVAGVDERGRPPEVVEEVREFLASPTADAPTTARLLGIDESRVVQLRALLRRRGPIESVLDEFAGLAQLPEPVLNLLAGTLSPSDLPGAEPVEPTRAAQAIWQATAPRVDPRWMALARRVRAVSQRAFDVVGALVLPPLAILAWRESRAGSPWWLALVALFVLGALANLRRVLPRRGASASEKTS
jgi:hypothetical protein